MQESSLIPTVNNQQVLLCVRYIIMAMDCACVHDTIRTVIINDQAVCNILCVLSLYEVYLQNTWTEGKDPGFCNTISESTMYYVPQTLFQPANTHYYITC